jgi:hypothetical protein
MGRDLRVLARTPPPAAERSTVVVARSPVTPSRRHTERSGLHGGRHMVFTLGVVESFARG